MGSLALLQSLKESVLTQASVKTVFGEPIETQGKTIIPVARISYGYGAGAGTGGVGDTQARGEGGGGGGGVHAVIPSEWSRSAICKRVSSPSPIVRSLAAPSSLAWGWDCCWAAEDDTEEVCLPGR
jgi:hypothetical protein